MDDTAALSLSARATFFERFVAMMIDFVLLTIGNYLLAAILDSGAASFASFAVSLGYFCSLEGGPTGATVGKRVMNIKVVRASTFGTLGFGTAFVRYLAHILSALAFGLGYFWMLWDPERQTWHDKIASTLVVPAR